jgi:mono/diheme cytochrome c family protein
MRHSPHLARLSGLVIAAAVGLTCVATAETAGDKATAEKSGKEQLVQQGYSLWRDSGCDACHSIGGGRRAGPDLMGVTDRRSHAWLDKWLLHTNDMLQSDPTAMALYNQYHHWAMPQIALNQSEVTALLAYINARSSGNGPGYK